GQPRLAHAGHAEHRHGTARRLHEFIDAGKEHGGLFGSLLGQVDVMQPPRFHKRPAKTAAPPDSIAALSPHFRRPARKNPTKSTLRRLGIAFALLGGERVLRRPWGIWSYRWASTGLFPVR